MKGGQYHKLLTSTGSPGSNQSGTIEWSTPQWLVDQLAEEFAPGGFDLDPAATADNAKAPRYFTVDHDGLSQPWHAKAVWCNFPFGKVSTPRWLAKAEAEVDLEHAGLVVCLTKVCAGTAWWQQYEADPAVFVRVIGRIRWRPDVRRESPFDFAIIVFGKLTDRHGRYPAVCANPACPRPYRRFWPARSDGRTCSPACRQALYRVTQSGRKRNGVSERRRR